MRAGFEVSKAFCYSWCFTLKNQDVSSQLFLLSQICSAIINSNPLKPRYKLSWLCMVSYHSNRKVTRTEISLPEESCCRQEVHSTMSGNSREVINSIGSRARVSPSKSGLDHLTCCETLGQLLGDSVTHSPC